MFERINQYQRQLLWGVGLIIILLIPAVVAVQQRNWQLREAAAAPTSPATPTASPSAPPIPTATPDRRATATTIAATATARVEATKIAVTATADHERLSARAKLIFRDEFVDNRNAWYTGLFQEIETNQIEDGLFKVNWAGRGTSYELYMVRDFSNFIAEIDCQLVEQPAAAGCGLIFSLIDDTGYYKYELFEDYYRLFLVRAVGEPKILAEGNPAGLITPGMPNRLRIVREGERIRTFLNGTALDEIYDATYLSGKIGITTSSYTEAGGSVIWFDNFAIWELPS